MSIGPDEVKRLARLARLALDEGEVARLSGELSSLVAYIEELHAIDVTEVAPMVSGIPAFGPAADASERGARRRPDEAIAGVGRRGIAGSAGLTDGLVRVPRVIE